MPDPTTPPMRESRPETAVLTRRVEPYAIVDSAWDAHHAELFNFLRRSTRDESAAEDLLQETFLRLTREVAAGRVPEQPRAWLYRVASNLATSRGRRIGTVVRWLATHGGREAEGRPVETPETHSLRRERNTELEAALAALSTDARTALILSGEGFSGLEIAATIGRSHAATRTLLSRARVQIRLEMERREGPR
jgi:RNA polymerase sigma factor (sigma-70 family)